VVAEGIEDAETYEMLSGWGCDEGQGYFMSKPVEAGVLAALLGGAPAPA
jgi:EAL domain-containing protein (putative c-di-GMP-specific phosphodiesterase class I)